MPELIVPPPDIDPRDDREALIMITTVSLRPLTDREFRQFRTLIFDEAGINLIDAKKALVEGRLARRINELGLRDYGAYFHLVENQSDERTRLIDAICTNETRFFREPMQFEFLETRVLPQWRAAAERGLPRRVRAWSAACSTGEEPYSLAMTLARGLPDWAIDIVASDLSTKALGRAREGVWSIHHAEHIPLSYRKAYMLRGVRSEEGRMRVVPEIQNLIDFRQINLTDEALIAGEFDLIFCRNVLIYFDRPTKDAVVDRLLRRLAPGGLLFLGHAESLTGWSHRVRSVGPTIYAQVEASR
jgi:chemotaxis protein methyltransferase CheR